MKELTKIIIGLLFIGLFIFSCSSNNDKIKIGIVSSAGGFSDNSFNELAYQGFLKAQNDFDFIAESRNSQNQEDIIDNINYFIENDFDLIITLGFEATAPVTRAAMRNPTIDFALIDDTIPDPPSNLGTFVFRVDQSSFVCGYLAAFWADQINPDSPTAAWVGGPRIPEIENFRTGYEHGILHFNEINDKNVQVVGAHARSFLNPDQGVILTDSLINIGADVVFPFAGVTGYGVLHQTQRRGKYGIGVDFDQAITVPAVSNILLTSCMKRLDITVYDIVDNFLRDRNWGGGKTHFGTLASGAVDIAPFHNFEERIPTSLKTELDELRRAIDSGRIETGWDPE